MQRLGYSLIDENNTEVQIFGDNSNQVAGIPDMLVLPNGDHVHCPEVGPIQQWRLVERWLSDDPPSMWHKQIGRDTSFDGTRIVITVNYEASPTLTPVSVTPRQARLALLAIGKLADVESAVDAAGGATKITWDYATEIKRDDELVISLGATLGLTETDIDNLFRTAYSL